MQIFIEMAKAAIPVWQDVLIYGAVACCVGIFLTGSLKLLLLNKLNGKRIKKLLCFVLGLVLTAGAAAGYKLCMGASFQYYLPSLVVILPAEIVLYQLYENTLIRDGIDAIAKKFIGKIAPHLSDSLTNPNKEGAKAKLLTISQAAKLDVANEIQKIVANDLKNL